MSSAIEFNDINMNFYIDDLQVCVKQLSYGIFMKDYTRHSHGKNYYELHLVCGGLGRLIIENKEYALKTGTLYMTGPCVLHEQITDKQDPMQEYCIGLELKPKKSMKGSAFSTALLKTAFWLGEDTGECERQFMLLSNESKNRLIGCSINMQGAISSILVELVRHYTGSKKGSELSPVVPDDRRMNIVDSYFIYQYVDASEEGLGQLLGLSVRQIQRFLKKNYGKTFSEMKRQAKLNKAAEFIKNGMSIEDTAALVGYNSASFFRKILKQQES